MEWVETTAKTVEAAKEAALDRLGIAADEAEFEVLDEPRPGLFGRTRGEGRIRARVKPTQARPKQERRRRNSKSAARSGQASDTTPDTTPDTIKVDADEPVITDGTQSPAEQDSTEPKASRSRDRSPRNGGGRSKNRTSDNQENKMSNDEREPSPVSPQEVGDAAVTFMDGLVQAFGSDGSTELNVEGTELDVRVEGDALGLMVGPGGRTLNAIQDLARVSAQRRLGDHETRLRIDVAGYRAKRSAALQRFAAEVATSVRDSGNARALEAMNSADRKVIHDALNDEEGVESRSEGDDPNRRIVVAPI